jgi:hypothetical protein
MLHACHAGRSDRLAMNDYIFWAIIVALVAFAYWMRERHKWEYHNPYERRCKKCGRIEVEYCRDLRSWNQSWWEVHRYGDGSCTK